MRILAYIVVLIPIYLTGCATAPVTPVLPPVTSSPARPPLPTMPPGMTGHAQPEAAPQSVPVQQKAHTTVVAADWPPVPGTGFFQSSTDLVHWTTFYSFQVPDGGGTVTATNLSPASVMFYRVGRSVP